MRKILNKIVNKYIIKILNIYKSNLEDKNLIFENYLDQTIYFEIQHLIRLIKERKDENGKIY